MRDCLTKKCSKVLLNQQEKSGFLDILKRKNMPYLQKKALRKKIHEKAKKNNICLECGEFNGNCIFYYLNYIIVKFKLFKALLKNVVY
jgi:hypothetical protein